MLWAILDNDALRFYAVYALSTASLMWSVKPKKFIHLEEAMTMITRIDPFRELAGFFENFAAVTGVTGTEQLAFGTFAPAVEVYEDEHNLVLKLKVPRAKEKTPTVTLNSNTL